MTSNRYIRSCAGAAFIAVLAGVGAAPAAAAGTERQVEEGKVTPATSGPVALKSLFVEGTYVDVDEKNVPNPDDAEARGVRVGAVIEMPDLRLFAIPTASFTKTETDGANAFATITSDTKLWGGGLTLVHAVAPALHLHVGGRIGDGNQDLLFNGAGKSETELRSYTGKVGASLTFYSSEVFTASLFDEVAYRYLHADFDPTNSIDEGSAHFWSNELAVKGRWRVAEGTELSLGGSWVSLFERSELVGEDERDPQFGIVSAGFTQDISHELALYGSIDRVVADSKRDVTAAKIGIRARF